MPWKKPSAEDPTVLEGVAIPAGEDAVREMATVFADEFARLGYDEARLLQLFRNSFYVGPHGAYRALGEEEIRKIISEQVTIWKPVRHTVRDAPTGNLDEFFLSGESGKGKELIQLGRTVRKED